MTQRIQRHPYLAIYDGPDPSASTSQRLVSTTPLQALFLLNDPFVHEQSQGFADRLLTERSDDSERLERAYKLALGRAPETDETDAAMQFLGESRETLRAAGVASDEIDRQAWQALARAIFRLNEFVYID